MRETLTLNKSKREKPPTRREKLDDFLKECTDKRVLASPNEFSETVSVIPELYVALQTGRPELIKITKPRALTEEEAKALFHLIGVLIETNMALRDHTQRVGELVQNWADHFKGLHSLGIDIENFANFEWRS